MTKPKKPANNPTNQVRIIGGQFKRRSVEFISSDGLRPTPDRLRETLFNWLMADIFEARVLDVCAGSGVLAFEALSRGAKCATLIEPNTKQASNIKRHADIFKLTKADIHIINATAQTALPTLSEPFDIIFIDPPYALNLWHDIIHTIIKHQLYHTNTLFYIESDRPLDDILEPFSANLIKHSKVGQVYAGIFQLIN